MTVAEFALSEGTIAGTGEPELSELPIQYVLPSPSAPPPIGGAAWTPGDPIPLKRVVRHSDGPASATVALVIADGQSFEVLHPDAAAGRKEISLDFGDASRASARTWARRYLDVAATARRGITVELIPNIGPVPYLDFGIGDNISILGEQHRVVAIGSKVGADSIINWSLDLDQPRQLLEERLAAIMRRFLPGGAAGRTILPTPTQPSFPANQVANEDVHTWQWDGPLGEIQVYKNTVAISGALVDASDLTDPGDTAKTTIVDAARKYVRESDKLQISAGGGALSPSWVPPKGRWIQEVRATVSDDGATIIITLSVV